MSEAPRWGGGGLCSNRLDEFSMTGTADALNRPEFDRGSRGPGQQRRAFHLTATCGRLSKAILEELYLSLARLNRGCRRQEFFASSVIARLGGSDEARSEEH